MLAPWTGNRPSRRTGSRLRWISAASSNSRSNRSFSTSASAMRALRIARPAEDAIVSDVEVVGSETGIRSPLVDQLDGAHSAVVDADRCAHDRLGGVAGFPIDAGKETGIGGYVTHDLARVVLDGAPDDALIAGKAEAGDLGRAVAACAGQHLALVVEHEQCPALGVEVFGDAHQRMLQRLVDIA